jgi:hypothetical protein
MAILEERHQTRQTYSLGENLMNTANNNSALVNNSFTVETKDKICNCLGCYQFADVKVSLKIGEKLVTIFVCGKCKHKFKES